MDPRWGGKCGGCWERRGMLWEWERFQLQVIPLLPLPSCEITTREYCEFMHGYFHEEATLCSQVRGREARWDLGAGGSHIAMLTPKGFRVSYGMGCGQNALERVGCKVQGLSQL